MPVPIRYNWMHAPTKKTGNANFSTRVTSEIGAYRQINTWNQSNTGVWVYWIDTVDVWTYHEKPYQKVSK